MTIEIVDFPIKNGGVPQLWDSLPEGNSNLIGYYEQQYDDEVALNKKDIHPKVRAMLIGKTMTNDQALDLNPCHVSTPKLQHMLKP